MWHLFNTNVLQKWLGSFLSFFFFFFFKKLTGYLHSAFFAGSSILSWVPFALFEIFFFFFFWLRMKKARVGLLIALIFSGYKSGSLFVFCFLFICLFFGVFKLSRTEYEFSIWTFKHHSWLSTLVLNYHWILHLFFFSFFLLKQLYLKQLRYFSTNRGWIWMYMPMYGAVPLSSFSIWLHHSLWTLRFGFEKKIKVRFRLKT